MTTLMTLGLFVFELTSAPFETVSRQTDHRWAAKDRAGGPPAHQYLGPGADALTIDGVLMPELTGGVAQLSKLREMAAEGKAWILVSGDGHSQGKWFIASVTQKDSHHVANGQPRKIDFTLSLKRYWDDDPEALGSLPKSLP
jgi:phage protein U